MSQLKNLQPERVFYYFEEITKIPHGSGDMSAIASFCVEFAKKHNLKYYHDEENNVVIIAKTLITSMIIKSFTSFSNNCLNGIWQFEFTFCKR